MACTAHVLAAPVGNLTLPLQLWYSKKLQDHMNLLTRVFQMPTTITLTVSIHIHI